MQVSKHCKDNGTYGVFIWWQEESIRIFGGGKKMKYRHLDDREDLREVKTTG
jgi:hypothetical protein